MTYKCYRNVFREHLEGSICDILILVDEIRLQNKLVVTTPLRVVRHFGVLVVISAKLSPLMEVSCRLMALPQDLILRMFREFGPDRGQGAANSQCPACVPVVDVSRRKDKCGLDDVRKRVSGL